MYQNLKMVGGWLSLYCEGKMYTYRYQPLRQSLAAVIDNLVRCLQDKNLIAASHQ